MNQLNDDKHRDLRDRGLLNENEVAYVRGDLLVAVDVISEEKRILGKLNDLLNESSNRRVLKG